MQSDLDFYYTKERCLNIFNNAFNHLDQECNPMLTKCIFQVIGEGLKQFTLLDFNQCMPYLCQEEIFLKKAHRINLNESSFVDSLPLAKTKSRFFSSLVEPAHPTV